MTRARMFFRFTISSRSPVCLLKLSGSCIEFDGAGGSSSEVTAEAGTVCTGAVGCAVDSDWAGAASCFLLQPRHSSNDQTQTISGRRMGHTWLALSIFLFGYTVPNSEGELKSFG